VILGLNDSENSTNVIILKWLISVRTLLMKLAVVIRTCMYIYNEIMVILVAVNIPAE